MKAFPIVIDRETQLAMHTCSPQLHATAPQLPELTDQEILDVALQLEPLKGTTMEQAFIYFARAVLKKAQGKLTI